MVLVSIFQHEYKPNREKIEISKARTCLTLLVDIVESVRVILTSCSQPIGRRHDVIEGIAYSPHDSAVGRCAANPTFTRQSSSCRTKKLIVCRKTQPVVVVEWHHLFTNFFGKEVDDDAVKILPHITCIVSTNICLLMVHGKMNFIRVAERVVRTEQHSTFFAANCSSRDIFLICKA